MRTTVSLDPDIQASAETLRRAQHLSLSRAINTLARAGLAGQPTAPRPFEQRTYPMGLRIDVSNVAEALDLLDGTDRR